MDKSKVPHFYGPRCRYGFQNLEAFCRPKNFVLLQVNFQLSQSQHATKEPTKAQKFCCTAILHSLVFGPFFGLNMLRMSKFTFAATLWDCLLLCQRQSL